jgi:hypothetical protein
LGPRTGLDDMEKLKFFPLQRLELRPLSLEHQINNTSMITPQLQFSGSLCVPRQSRPVGGPDRRSRVSWAVTSFHPGSSRGGPTQSRRWCS